MSVAPLFLVIGGKDMANEKIKDMSIYIYIMHMMENCEELNEILDLNYEDKLSGEVAEKFFFDSVRALRGAKIEEDIAKCNALYAATTDEEERKKIAKQLSELVRRKSALKK